MIAVNRRCAFILSPYPSLCGRYTIFLFVDLFTTNESNLSSFSLLLLD
ncbi:hypothetical protein CAMSH0001_1494 [Campylobacter showae RM3277]|uniref:Uncharacterized protein n=1 Tax=Campylobacter showae RM3277 TaxID=553219 RepID=C6RCQ8_9BACT|nr:hypothetical protein CAMSH0001_1494 [Campylobacter showae RM3277]